MSTTATDENSEKINYIGFNQDSKVISVGHKDGYMFYKTADILDNSTLTYEGENLTHLGLNNCLIVERLFSSALMVVISQKDPRVLHVYHFTSRNIICDHRFNKSVLTVRLNRDRIVVCLEDCIYIYNLKDMKMMHNIMDTPMNKLGVIDLTSNAGHALVAYPGSTDTGSVNLFDAINLSSVNTFVAHEGTLACLKFNQEGNMIATASTKGTVIRVFSVPTGNRLFEFRRGVSRCVTIYSLCFSSDSKYLSSSSNTETVHVFKLEKTETEDHKPLDGFAMLGKILVKLFIRLPQPEVTKIDWIFEIMVQQVLAEMGMVDEMVYVAADKKQRQGGNRNFVPSEIAELFQNTHGLADENQEESNHFKLLGAFFQTASPPKLQTVNWLAEFTDFVVQFYTNIVEVCDNVILSREQLLGVELPLFANVPSTGPDVLLPPLMLDEEHLTIFPDVSKCDNCLVCKKYLEHNSINYPDCMFPAAAPINTAPMSLKMVRQRNNINAEERDHMIQCLREQTSTDENAILVGALRLHEQRFGMKRTKVQFRRFWRRMNGIEE